MTTYEVLGFKENGIAVWTCERYGQKMECGSTVNTKIGERMKIRCLKCEG